MANHNDTELAAVMDFFSRYKRVLAFLVIFFVVVLVGTNYWRQRRITTASDASQLFQDMAVAELQHQSDTAKTKGKTLMEDYSGTIYAQFAGLLMAKIDVNEGNLDAAIKNLQWVAARKTASNITGHLATVRLAAVLQQQGKLDEAMKLVAEDPDQAYAALYAQARGDIYVAKGDTEQAKKAYMLALQSLPQGTQASLLQMKLLDLGGDNEV